MDFYPDLEGLPLFAKPAFGWEDSVSAAPADPPSAKPRRPRQWRGPITHWERGYRSHYYRDKRGKKLGEIHLSPRGQAPLLYRWLAGTLSGGEQQMVAMARALMGRPRLICMDEPTMGLSPRYVDHVLDLIAQVNATGVSVFMVEQNASLALRIAHHGYVLQNGRIVLSGPARELLHDPRIRHAYLGGEAA
jgi:ABC-type glutathione transport system ATPase component